jgi:hypothetical protein
VTFSDLAYLADAATDADVLRELAGAYGQRVAALPPVALVIAARPAATTLRVAGKSRWRPRRQDPAEARSRREKPRPRSG